MQSIATHRRAVLGAALAAPWLGGRASAQGITLRSADIHPDGYPTIEGVKFMGRLVEQRTNGRIRIQVFHSRQLGDEKDTLEQTRFGVIDMTRVNTAPLNNLVPETLVAGLPFLFRDTAHMQRVMDGPIGEDIGKGTLSHGLVTLCYYDAGARSFYTRAKPARTPDDLKGMKIRVQQSDMWVAMMRAFGANATPLPYGEVYSALQTGVVDGAENNFPSYLTARHFEVAKHYALTEHSLTPEILAMSKRSWDRLPAADRDILKQAAKESVPHMRALWVKMEEDARKQVEAGGATVVEADKPAFARLVQPVYDQFVRDAKLRQLVDRIREG
ncbi:TRAP transporter substrate-binding protein [Siccirubricoccus sp. KC 17139]|uniref:TRAP transporter substrate-binding protein n=1 Tax=Siccirubricoccus soli TaxID=2899147 RepID=A0ABT1DB68_9PROT|nr:TRAP transporter substrate-binding protein [Siccirubricoccus soli]MCO6419184.1 TRAP transporter substrate-binding protein [Siccirubricoccus soli]MCP2685319.1 TRAP transporter substrate-binding protein [Siccirubricoccus soli]